MFFDIISLDEKILPSSLPREAYKMKIPSSVIEPIQVTVLPKRIVEYEPMNDEAVNMQLKEYYIEEKIHFSE